MIYNTTLVHFLPSKDVYSKQLFPLLEDLPYLGLKYIFNELIPI